MRVQTLLKIAVLSVGLLGLLATFSIAEDDLSKRGPVSFTTYDTDGNGLISQQEFDELKQKRKDIRKKSGRAMRKVDTSPQFSDFDTDGDGQITPVELKAGQNARMGQGNRGQGRKK